MELVIYINISSVTFLGIYYSRKNICYYFTYHFSSYTTYHQRSHALIFSDKL